MNQVVYASRGGNTKKIAEAIARGAGAPAQSADTAKLTGKVDVLFVGGGIYAGKIDGSLREFLKNLQPGGARKVVAFSSAAGKAHALAEIRSILEPKGIKVSDEDFHCKGAFLFVNKGHPDDADLRAAEAFAARQREV